MPASEAWRDAPRALRRVRHREAFTDLLGGVAFVGGVAQAGMPAPTVARLRGLGIPLDDLGPWEDAPEAPPAVAVADLAPADDPPADPAPTAEPVVPLAPERQTVPGPAATARRERR